METKEYNLTISKKNVVVASLDMTDASNMIFVQGQIDYSLLFLLTKPIINWIIEQKLKGVFYDTVENAALAAISKLKDYSCRDYKNKYYSFVQMLSDDYFLFLKEKDGKVIIGIERPNWEFTYNTLKQNE